MTSALARLRLGLGRDVTLANLAHRLGAVYGDRRLVEDGDTGSVLTFRYTAERIDRWAGAIQARIDPGDRVVLATPNRYDQFLLCLAVARAGGIAVPVNSRMRPEEVDHVVADAGAHLVVHDPEDVRGGPALHRQVAPAPGEVAALFYTSGTTGEPKGVELTHAGLLGAMPRAVLAPALQLRRDEAVVALPIAHIMGFVACVGFACAGVPVLFHERFHADQVLDAIESRRSTMFIGVPAMYRLLLEAGAGQRDLTSIRVWASGADVMPPELARQFQKMGAAATLPGIGPVGEALFFEGYGMAEMGGAVAVRVDPPGGLTRRLLGDAVGVRVPGYRLKVVRDDGTEAAPGEVGELWVKGPGVTPGYWGNEAASAALLPGDGWMRTGDLARLGPLGSVSFQGRVKDVVKSGGYSVYALEVEAALARHPDVAEAAVLGLPDPRLGEQVVAAVHLAPGSTATEEDLLAFCREHLSGYKCPRRIAFVDELPRTGSAKVQKSQLRRAFEG